MFSQQREATTEERQFALKILRNGLPDPYSVRDASISYVVFPKKVSAISLSSKMFCVSFNAKNLKGAYVGKDYWVFKFNDSGVLFSVDNTDYINAQCFDKRLKYAPFTELEDI